MLRIWLPLEAISYILSSNMKENVMDEECSTYVRDDNFIQEFIRKYHLGD
jgi:hypothetical protein